jgi:hypothetical protein
LIANGVELLRVYPKWRLQSLVLQRVTSVFVSLRGQLSDDLRELNFCRGRLGKLQEYFESEPVDELGQDDLAMARTLFPSNSRTLEEATAQMAEKFGPEQIHELDCQMQAVIRQHCSSLAHVCLSTSNLLPNVRQAMQNVAEAYVNGKLEQNSLTEMFFARYGDASQNEVQTLFEQASPKLAGNRVASSREFCIMAVPSEAESGRFADTVRQSTPRVEWIQASSKDDVILYRECAEIPFSELEHLGPLGAEAYRQMASLEHFTPHSRSDISQWESVSA